jgi:anti-sigma B factor antagonist
VHQAAAENRFWLPMGVIGMSVTITTRDVGDVAVMDVSGRITAGDGSNIFRQAIRDQVAHGSKQIVLNLQDVTYIDSSGLGELVLGHGTVSQNICESCSASVFQNDQGEWDPCPQCENTGRTTWGKLKLTNLNSQVRELLEFSRLNTVFDIHESEDLAVQSF